MRQKQATETPDGRNVDHKMKCVFPELKKESSLMTCDFSLLHSYLLFNRPSSKINHKLTTTIRSQNSPDYSVE